MAVMPPESRRDVRRATKMSPFDRTAIWRARPTVSATIAAQNPSGSLMVVSQPEAPGCSVLRQAAAVSRSAAARGRARCMVAARGATTVRGTLERHPGDQIAGECLGADQIAIENGHGGPEPEVVRRIPRQNTGVQIELGAHGRDTGMVLESGARAYLAVGGGVRTPRHTVVAEQRERRSVEECREQADRAVRQQQRCAILGAP